MKSRGYIIAHMFCFGKMLRSITSAAIGAVASGEFLYLYSEVFPHRIRLQHLRVVRKLQHPVAHLH